LIENDDNILAINNQHQSILPVMKTILYWNSFFGKKDFTFGVGQQPFVNAKCPTATCYATDDRSLFNESVVVGCRHLLHPRHEPDRFTDLSISTPAIRLL
jgi:alpha-1,3-fucosyltransferase